jgi:hypothetical protein
VIISSINLGIAETPREKCSVQQYLESFTQQSTRKTKHNYSTIIVMMMMIIIIISRERPQTGVIPQNNT